MIKDIKVCEEFKLPNYESLGAEIKQAIGVCMAYDPEDVHTFPTACLLNMSSNALKNLEAQNPTVSWQQLVSDLRFLASWALDTYPQKLQPDDFRILKAIYDVKGCAFMEAMALYEAERAVSAGCIH